jgi:biopolymer transport protein ExbD
MKFQRKRKEKIDISITSMIDVVFLLLIFFMVTTSFSRQTELKINLPEAKGSEAEDNLKTITLEIDVKGTYNLIASDGLSRRIPPGDNREPLVQEIAKLASQSKDLPFIIKADDNTPNKAVMTALDVAGEHGFKHISFATSELKEEE